MITGVPQLPSALPQSVARRWEQFVVPSLTVALDIGMRSSMFVRLQFLPSMIPLPTCVAVIRNATSFSISVSLATGSSGSSSRIPFYLKGTSSHHANKRSASGEGTWNLLSGAGLTIFICYIEYLFYSFREWVLLSS